MHNISSKLCLCSVFFVLQIVLNGTMLATMVVAGRAVVRGEMTLGGWLAVQTWVVGMFGPLNFLGTSTMC